MQSQALHHERGFNMHAEASHLITAARGLSDFAEISVGASGTYSVL